MRVYFEKPRTRVGWKGLINDPHLDGSFRINEGLALARGLLVSLAEQGCAPAASSSTPSPRSSSRTPSPGAPSARAPPRARCTASSPRASRCRWGSRTARTANVRIAIDAVTASGHPHCFLSVTKQGLAAIVETEGQPGHPPHPARRPTGAQLRRGVGGRRLRRGCGGGAAPPADGGLLSHGNSGKDPAGSSRSPRDLAGQRRRKTRRCSG